MKLPYIFIIGLFTILNSCKDTPCITDNKCGEQPMVFFCVTGEESKEAWYYDYETKDCLKKTTYRDLSLGFDTKEECKKCDCNNDNIETNN